MALVAFFVRLRNTETNSFQAKIRAASSFSKDLRLLSMCFRCVVCRQNGLLRELNPGPLAPEARIMPLDQAANNAYRIIGCHKRCEQISFLYLRLNHCVD